MGVKTGVVVSQALTAGGPTQDITISGFGTVKAYIVVASRGFTDGTWVQHMALSYGFASGPSNEFCMSSVSEDNVTTSNTAKEIRTTRVISLRNGDQTMLAEAHHDSFITDGVKISWDTLSPGAWRLQWTFFGGDDLEVEVGSGTHTGFQNADIDVTTSFDPDAVLFFTAQSRNANATLDGGLSVDANIQVGGASRDSGTRLWTDGTAQGHISWQARDGRANAEGSLSTWASDAAEAGVTDVNRVIANYGIQPQNDNGWLCFTGITDSNSFELRKLDKQEDLSFGWMAFKSATNRIHCKVGESPVDGSVASVTGDNATTGMGFKPQNLVMFMSAQSTLDAIINTGNSVGAIACAMTDGVTTSSIVAYDDDALGVTNTNVRWDSGTINLTNANGGTTIFDNTFTSFDPDGFTMNYSSSQAKRFWLLLAIEEDRKETPGILASKYQRDSVSARVRR